MDKSTEQSIHQYKCFSCDFKGRSKQKLDEHTIVKHEKDPQLHKCSMCDKTFILQRYLKVHERTHQQNKIKCDKCDMQYKGKSQLLVHIKNVHEGVRYNCESCDYETTQQGHLNAHVKRIHDKIKDFKCSICEYSSQSKQQLAIHITTHQTEREMVNCPLCSKHLLLASLKNHIKETHDVQRKHKCNKCDKLFKRSDHLTIHLRSVHDGQRVSCKFCGKQFSKNGHLRTHLIGNHLPDKQILFDCVMCGKQYKDKSGLNNHMESKHSSQEFKCEEKDCIIVCSSRVNLRFHFLDIHKGRTKFCSICKKDIKRNCFTSHVRAYHRGDQTSSCLKCNKEILTKRLKHHIREVHEDSKTLQCNECDSKFKRKEHLTTHIAIMHRGVRYKCETCEKELTSEAALKRHQQSVHQKIRKICEICFKEYTLSSYESHIRRDHKKDDLECKVCKFRTQKKHELMKHVMTHLAPELRKAITIP